MPHYLVKLADDEYVEWSTIVDAPITYIMNREEAIAYTENESESTEKGKDRVARVDEKGHSAHYFGPETPEQLVAGNRAGDKEKPLSLAEIRERYRIKSNPQEPSDPPADPDSDPPAA